MAKKQIYAEVNVNDLFSALSEDEQNELILEVHDEDSIKRLFDLKTLDDYSLDELVNHYTVEEIVTALGLKLAEKI